VLAYVDRMDLAYAAADLAVCRAGAMTCAELSAVGLPAVYVPLPIGNGEQALNARPVVDAGGGLLVEDAAFDAARVRADVLPLLRDDARLAAMGRAAAGSGHRDAGRALAELVLHAAGARGTGAGARSGQEPRARRRPRPRPLRRDRRRRHERDRGASCSPAALRCPAATPRPPGDGPRCVPSRTVHLGHAASHVDEADTVVVSTAIRPDNPELVAARERGLRCAPARRGARRADGRTPRRRGGGHHGKTTTTSTAHRRRAALRRRPVLRHRR
jgi:hypothetical protein